jgi:hypothetical protein
VHAALERSIDSGVRGPDHLAALVLQGLDVERAGAVRGSSSLPSPAWRQSPV